MSNQQTKKTTILNKICNRVLRGSLLHNDQKIIQIAIDANEANVEKRVGSNVYAYQLIKQLEAITRHNDQYQFSILLSNNPVADLPKKRVGWNYYLIQPQKFWTQWALPIHLFFNRKKYDVLFTAGHYAPRIASVPYVSCVMDLAFLHFKDQFKQTDFLQLQAWTRYSVKKAKKVVCISEFTKQEVHQIYKKPLADLLVAYPDVSLPNKPCSYTREKAFWRKHQIRQPYFLYLGTLQPRKNLIKLIEAFEIFSRKLASSKVHKKQSNRKKDQQLAQLLIGGKVGWLAQATLKRIEQSPFKNRIKLLGFVPEDLKPSLYQQSLSTILIGLYEGFGIPALEAMHYQSLPLVSNTSSLPEVVGKAGLTVDPQNASEIAEQLFYIYQMTAKQRAQLQRHSRKQIQQFSWQKSAELILETLTTIAKSGK